MKTNISGEAPANKYLSVVYDEAKRPVTPYPGQLAEHLFQRFGMKRNQLFLEAGVGRGDFLKGFHGLGLDCRGCDISHEAKALLPEFDIAVGDIEQEGMSYSDNTFDIVYSKSLLEHFFRPERYLKEALRILKPGGLCLTLVPDWESNFRTYFDDFTHRTPFTTVSPLDIYGMCGFAKVDVQIFRQLPLVWRYPRINYACRAISAFVPVRTKNKYLRWSRELMLLGSGYKPG